MEQAARRLFGRLSALAAVVLLAAGCVTDYQATSADLTAAPPDGMSDLYLYRNNRGGILDIGPETEFGQGSDTIWWVNGQLVGQYWRMGYLKISVAPGEYDISAAPADAPHQIAKTTITVEEAGRQVFVRFTIISGTEQRVYRETAETGAVEVAGLGREPGLVQEISQPKQVAARSEPAPKPAEAKPAQTAAKPPAKPKLAAPAAKPKPAVAKPAKVAAKPKLAAPKVATAAENRFGVAVIIGNAAYSEDRVPDVAYAHRDAEAFKAYVTDVLGFREGNIIDLRDATQAQMVAAFGTKNDFKGKVYDWVRPGKSDVVVFYSGHGVPGGGADRRGYLLPANANPDKARLNGYPIDVLYQNLAQVQAKSVTVFIDACFSGDTPRGMLIQSASPVFVEASLPEAANGLTVLTAASGVELASWDEEREHGLFTSYVLDGLYGAADGKDFGDGDGKVTLAELQGWLDSEMTYHARREYSRDQHATVQGDGALVLNTVPEIAAGQVASARAAPTFTVTPLEDTLYTLENAKVRAGPGTEFEEVARLVKDAEVEVTGRVEDKDWVQVALAGGASGFVYGPLLGERLPSAAQPAVGLAPAAPAPVESFKDCDVCPEMVMVPAGSFLMGSPPTEEDRFDHEGPVHAVAIPKAFAVGKYEVTFAEWDACLADGGCNGHRPDDAGWGRGTRPVIKVNWKDANAYTQWLSRKTGKNYRLLSEAEWEYAARAGTTTARPWGDENASACTHANLHDMSAVLQGTRNIEEPYPCEDGFDHTAPVGSYAPNAFGLHDMLGNVFEWTADCWNDSYSGAPSDGSAWTRGNCNERVIRGQSWFFGAGEYSGARLAFRLGIDASARKDRGVGFRVARGD